MKTADLIDLLAVDTLPVQRRAASRRLARGLLVAVPASLLLMAAMLGLNPAIGAYLALPMFWVKFGTPLTMAVAALWLVARSGVPGMGTGLAWAAWGLPVVLLWLLALWVLVQAPASDVPKLVLSHTWRVCAENIVLLSLPFFLAALWTLKGLAPVRPALAGAGAGALAGACGATVYALHCPELAAPFIAVWYVLGMALPVVAGALVGPRLLRW